MTRQFDPGHLFPLLPAHNALSTLTLSRKVCSARQSLHAAKAQGTRGDVFCATLRLDGAKWARSFSKATAVPRLLAGENLFGTSFLHLGCRIADAVFDDDAATLKNIATFRQKLPRTSIPAREGLMPFTLGTVLTTGGFLGGLALGTGMGLLYGAAAGLLRSEKSILQAALDGVFNGAISGSALGAMGGFAVALLVSLALGCANLAVCGSIVGAGRLLGYGYGVAAGAINAARFGTNRAVRRRELAAFV